MIQFLESLLIPWLLLLPVPLIIFSATPRMPFWYKSGRIIFLWLITLILIIYAYGPLPNYDPDWHGGPYIDYLLKHIVLLTILFAIVNMYMGWWEFLWRCIYRQWAWPPLKNLQYGLVSNLCILGSVGLKLSVLILLALTLTRVI